MTDRIPSTAEGLLLAIAAYYRWAGRPPQRDRIASWPALRVVVGCVAALALAVLLDPDHGIVKQGAHMWVVGPVVWALLLGAPVTFVRWATIRRSARPGTPA